MTAEDEFHDLLDLLHNQLGHPDDFDALLAASSLGAPHVQAILNGTEPGDDPHAGCRQPHTGADGHTDCNGRPL